MNLYGSESQINLEAEKEKTKKLMKLISIALIILFIMSICIFVYIAYLQKKQLKVYVDDARIKLTSDMFIITEDKKVYVSLNDIASRIGYTMNNGEYKDKYSEDTKKCHLTNKYEAASYVEGSDEIYKTIIPENAQSDFDHDYYTINEPVFLENNKLYTTLEGLGKGCNLNYSYNPENNTVEIYTLDYLAKFYSKGIPDSVELITQEDLNAYKNKKAILYNMMVVKNEDGKFGVNALNNSTVIGEKYKSITFMELPQEFVVETEDGKFGIIDKNGSTKINPKYASIKQIEKEKGLYLVSTNSNATSGRTQYGIINKKEKVIVYLEYDQIGIEKSDFPANEIDNPYFLYGKCIPVKKSNKWGVLDMDGNTILPIEYDDLGCKSNASKDNHANSLLLVPEYEAIVVNKDKLYGLFNSSGKELIQALTTDMYVINSSGENKYYLTYLGNPMDIINYLKNTIGIEPVKEVSSEYDKPLEEYYPNNDKNNSQTNSENNSQSQNQESDVNNEDTNQNNENESENENEFETEQSDETDSLEVNMD